MRAAMFAVSDYILLINLRSNPNIFSEIWVWFGRVEAGVVLGDEGGEACGPRWGRGVNGGR